MKILHTGDLHLDSPFSSEDIIGAERRREAQRRVITRIFDLAKEESCDLILIAGDLFDSEYVSPETEKLVLKLLGEAGINPADKIREFAGRVEIVHLKDFVCKELGGGPAYDLIDNSGKGLGKKSREDNGFQFRPLGTGRQNFLEILEACEASGTEYVIVEQDQTYDIPELEAAKISRDYLRETFGL